MAVTGQVQIAASILAADFSKLGEQVEEAMNAGIRRIHVDVMDGLFVPNLSMGPLVVQALQPLRIQYAAELHAHLMIADPDRYIPDFVRAGADSIIVHVEACTHLFQTIRNIGALGVRRGVAVNPATPLTMLEEILTEVDLVLIMSVEPGFGGQEFIRACLDKIVRLHRLLSDRHLDHVDIAVDGGIRQSNAEVVVRAGAHILVAGSAIFNTQASVSENVQALVTAIRRA